MLRPPFEGGNPLVVARTIVEGTYAPLDAGYSELLSRVVTRLLCVQPEQRPDIDEVWYGRERARLEQSHRRVVRVAGFVGVRRVCAHASGHDE